MLSKLNRNASETFQRVPQAKLGALGPVTVLVVKLLSSSFNVRGLPQ